jgi:hypothetical protein
MKPVSNLFSLTFFSDDFERQHWKNEDQSRGQKGRKFRRHSQRCFADNLSISNEAKGVKGKTF